MTAAKKTLLHATNRDYMQATMASGGGAEATPLMPSLMAFKKITAGANKRTLTEMQKKFVKKLDCMPSIELPIEETCRSTLNLVDRGLIGQFTSLWPSPKAVEEWVQRN